MEEKLLPAVQRAYDINYWLLLQVERFSRRHKFTLGDRILGTALDLCMALVEAAHSRSKEAPLYRANRLLDQLRILLRLSHAVQQISTRRYEYITTLNEELGRMIGGWLRSVRTEPHSHGRRKDRLVPCTE